MYLFLVCFSQTNIYEKARKYTTIFFILQIFRPQKTLFYFSDVRFGGFCFFVGLGVGLGV